MKQRIRPLTYEYIKQRETPLKVEVYSGCVTTCDLRILQVEPPIYAVLGIEIIEHLDPEILRKFERTVFGLLNPPVVSNVFMSNIITKVACTNIRCQIQKIRSNSSSNLDHYYERFGVL